MKLFLFFMCLVLPVTAFSELFDLEARTAYFVPQDHRMREIYNQGFQEYEVEATFMRNCCLSPWLNFSYFDKSGCSSCQKVHTDVHSYGFTLGLKKFFWLCEGFQPYLGLGLGANYVKFHDKACYVRERTKKWSPAFTAKSGLIFDLGCNFFLDLFADYVYSQQNSSKSKNCIKSRSVNTGGGKFGFGIGYHF